MPPIKQLPDHLINQIAAGEVVERPASIVKELVENSLDANATQIIVELEDGGKKLIRVRDNGLGIEASQLKLAVSRHSTSKISNQDDLFNIQTLGFRGEALASMASVSKMTITSKFKNSTESAYEINIEGGQILSQKQAAHPDGTSVAVKYLFYNTPARLKFLKAKETEISHITDYITKAALAHPQITFKLIHQSNELVKVLATTTIRERVKDLFGKEITDACYEISWGRDGLEVFGLVGHPQISRSHNRHMYQFVNGRPVKDKTIYHAIFEGYRDLLMTRRYPFVVLFIKVPSMMVDVNVHPAKTEVRFSNSQIIHRAVYEAVREKLVDEPWKKEPELKGASLGLDEKKYAIRPETGISPYDLNDNDLFMNASQEISKIIDETYATQNSYQHVSQIISKKVNYGQTPYSQLRVIGQVLGTYILCEAKDKLVLIDQHAAHERVNFEKLIKQFEEGKIHSQQLLVPENFDLKPSDAEILKKYIEELSTFGLEIESFSGNTFSVKQVPVLLGGKVSIKDLVLDLIGDVLEKGELTSLKDNFHDLLASMACRKSIMAHDILTHDEIKSLLKELDQWQFTSFCPHGRPVMVEVDAYEMEKWFKRVV